LGHARAQAEASIDAPPAAVYEVLADYETHHPRIMPPSLFSNLEVEEGGIGADTVFHITLRIAGKKQRLHMRVGEPEPGRVLTETNLDTDVVTAFTVAPSNGGSTTGARISSEWESKEGIGGLVDRTITPLLLRWIFRKQLRELARYMRSEKAPKHV
jgi:hypothetical protein